MLPKPSEIDGKDFINIYSKGKTSLGRWLTNFARSPIEIPEHGCFQSIEGYWYWLGTRDERLRDLVGFQAKQLGRQLKSDKQVESVDGFEEFIKAAIDLKLKSRYDMMQALAATDLPLFHFYEYGNKRIDAGYEWILEHIDLRRRQLKEYFQSKENL